MALRPPLPSLGVPLSLSLFESGLEMLAVVAVHALVVKASALGAIMAEARAEVTAPSVVVAMASGRCRRDSFLHVCGPCLRIWCSQFVLLSTRFTVRVHAVLRLRDPALVRAPPPRPRGRAKSDDPLREVPKLIYYLFTKLFLPCA